ncbi:hypothetical protein ACFLY8_01395 [Halobacteriota archaeon]
MQSKEQSWIDDRSDISKLSLVEMGRDDATLTCTQGKISLWIGKKTKVDLIKRILSGISKVDPSVGYESEVICDFDAIEKYESRGYVLVSYARTKGKYRVVFHVPLSRKDAMVCFAESVIDELRRGDTQKSFLWNGNVTKIMLLFTELNDNVMGWQMRRMEFKDDSDGYSRNPPG